MSQLLVGVWFGSVTQRTSHPTRQALLVWLVFIALVVVLNGTIPFALGADLQAWTFSITKNILDES